MFKCERKVVRKFALETEKLMHSLYPMDIANKFLGECIILFLFFKIMENATSFEVVKLG
jgi:hypothetical protein